MADRMSALLEQEIPAFAGMTKLAVYKDRHLRAVLRILLLVTWRSILSAKATSLVGIHYIMFVAGLKIQERC